MFSLLHTLVKTQDDYLIDVFYLNVFYNVLDTRLRQMRGMVKRNARLRDVCYVDTVKHKNYFNLICCTHQTD